MGRGLDGSLEWGLKGLWGGAGAEGRGGSEEREGVERRINVAETSADIV